MKSLLLWPSNLSTQNALQLCQQIELDKLYQIQLPFFSLFLMFIFLQIGLFSMEEGYKIRAIADINLKLAPLTDINLDHILVKYRAVCKKCVDYWKWLLLEFISISLYTRAFQHQRFHSIAYIDQELLNDTFLDILICKIYKSSVITNHNGTNQLLL